MKSDRCFVRAMKFKLNLLYNDSDYKKSSDFKCLICGYENTKKFLFTHFKYKHYKIYSQLELIINK
jgi:hypothetical protein